MKVATEAIVRRQRQLRNRGAVCIALVELCDQPFQIRTTHASVESVDRRSGQEVARCAVTVEVDTPKKSTKRCDTRIGKIEGQFKPTGKSRYTGDIQNVCEVCGKRSVIGEPIIEIEPIGRVRSGIARISVGSKQLKTV